MPFERLSGRAGKLFLLDDFAFKDESDAQLGTVDYQPIIASDAVNFPSPSLASSEANGPTTASTEGEPPQLDVERVSTQPPVQIWHVPRVLVADDNLLVRTSLLHLLEKWQFNYQLASCGLTAWEHLQDATFDLLLIDLQMPGMDGYELVNRLRGLSSNPNSNIPVIAMAGTTDNWAREQMLSVGACAYLEKPLHPEHLFDAVTQHIRLPEHQQVRLFTDIVDQGLLDELYQGDLQHLSLMLDLFLQKTPQIMQDLHRALSQQDGDQLSKDLHSVKPTFAMVGLPQLTDMAAELERYLEQQDKQLDGKFNAGFVQFRRLVERALVIIDEKQQALREHLK